jgi:hypothetical protein
LELSDCYEMNFLQRKLSPIGNLLKPRYGHEMVYAGEGLYVIGGSNDSDGMLRDCEHYDLKTEGWRAIAPLNKRAFGPAACNWEGKYIYKFGGLLDDKVLNNTIERYDIKKNLWQIVNFEINSNRFSLFNDDFILPWCCGVTQINSQQILVVGGYLSNNENSQQFFIFNLWPSSFDKENIHIYVKENESNKEIDNDIPQSDDNDFKHAVSHVNRWILPVGEGFWNSQAIVNQKQVFCLQNIQVEEFQSTTKPDLRRLLSFEKYKWDQWELEN